MVDNELNVKSFIINYDAIKPFRVEENEILIVNEISISELIILEKCLELFQKLEIQCLSLQKRDEVTINTVLPVIWYIRDELLANKDLEKPQIVYLKKQLSQEFNKRIDKNYQDTLIQLQLASYLDPENRTLKLIKYESEIKKIYQQLQTLIQQQEIEV
ncbi:hypothetical protein ABPG72_009305 [Tetrahymena utriculariae]